MMKGDDVLWLQKQLNAILINVGTPAGSYNARTRCGVLTFQHVKGLAEDGVVGRNTWAAILHS
jgi:peptidoglycan hydrolase-like protein with peptidoglycan-binding domain